LKEDLIKEYTSMPKEVVRSTFIRKIQDLSGSLAKANQDHERVRGEIHALQDSIQIQDGFIDRFYIELDNLFKMDPKRKETIVVSVVYYIQTSFRSHKSTMSISNSTSTTPPPSRTLAA
jgi:hypothetical protein